MGAGNPSVLAGLRVVEYATAVAGPLCARILADLGAEVVKVEPPGGDPVRSWGPFPGDRPDPEASGNFAFLNAGKQAAVADLADAAERERLHGLLADADVFVDGLAPGEVQSWGLDAGSLLDRHPGLVVVSVTPHGRSGPWADAPGTDLTAAALSSLCLGLGEPDREPLRLPYDQVEVQAALHAVAAVLCALRERDRSGLGQAIDVAAAQVAGYCVGGMHLVTAKVGGRWRRGGRLQVGTIYPTGFFECADGYVCIASQTPKQWGKFLRVMGDPDWAAPEAARRTTGLGPDPALVDGPFRAWMAQRTRAEVVDLAIAEDITLGAVMTPAELLEDKHLDDRNAWVELAVGAARVRVARPGLILHRSPLSVGHEAPPLRVASAGNLPAATGPATPTTQGPPPAAGGERRPPLEGVRVLDFTWNWAGPMATQLLADMGADVIRVETAKRQDLMRLLDMTSWFFCHNNRSKRSLAVNVAHPDGLDVVYRLLPAVDVVVDNFTPGVMERNRLDYESLRAVKADIISVSMSIAGQTGPLRGMRGFAAMGTGFAGLERLVGYEDGTATGLMSFGLGDVTLAIHATIGALAALRHRERTGEGQLVDVSMIEAVLGGLPDPVLDVQLGGRQPGPQGNRHRAHVPHGVFRCAGDDRFVALAVRHTGEWQRLCRILGRDDWAADESLASPTGRRRREGDIDAAIAGWCATRQRDEVVAILRAAAVPVAPLLQLPERDGDPHFVERGFVVDHDAGFDRCRVYATPWRFSATPPAVRRPTPVLGEHTGEVLRELAGLSDAEITRLSEAGVLA